MKRLCFALLWSAVGAYLLVDMEAYSPLAPFEAFLVGTALTAWGGI